jgi:hypothetical protein
MLGEIDHREPLSHNAIGHTLLESASMRWLSS